MTDPATIPAPTTLKPEEQAVLDYIQAVGMKLVGEVEADLDARKAQRTSGDTPQDNEAPRPSLAEISLTFSRASRALRLTLMLRARLAGDLAEPTRSSSRLRPAPDPAAEAAAAQHDAVSDCRKIRILRTIAGDAWREHNDRDEIDRLVREGAERLEDEDLQDLVMTLPLGEIVRRIAQDLGLAADWPGLDQRLWGKFELMPPDLPLPDDVPLKRQTCLDRPDPVLATKKGPGRTPVISIRTIADPPARNGESARPP